MKASRSRKSVAKKNSLLKIINSSDFKHTLLDIHKHSHNRKFCFVIGAGASRKSGIPTGSELANIWFEELKTRVSQQKLNVWIKELKIDLTDLAASYGKIYRKRFENDKISGYEFLVQAMKDARPSLGHFVLAQVLSRYSGHCVVTTNFDSLIESSVYQLTNKTPLVCGHESLSGYARPSATHPLIVKIHRDLLLSPKSDENEINTLDAGWKQPLDHIFTTHIPIVIGYGGNDGSLMNYFEQMSKPSNFFWCGLDPSSASRRVQKLIIQHDGSYVKIDGFDELMHELLQVFDDVKPIQDELTEITNERIRKTNEQLEEIKQIFRQAEGSDEKELSAIEFVKLAENEPDLNKRKEIYLRALDKYPTTGWLWWSFTYFLHYEKKDYQNLDSYYLEAVKFNENEPGLLGNYALYLRRIKKDFIQAEEYYHKVLKVAPDNAANLGNYANFLNEDIKDSRKAEEYYLRAIEADPNHATNLGNYANFLKKDFKKDFQRAEEYYLKAIKADPNHATNLGNYANFLRKDLRKHFDLAEELYVRALNADPNDVNNLCGFAVLQMENKKDYDKAEVNYLKALSIDPNNTICIGLYANFLQGVRRDDAKAEKYYLMALNVDPNGAANLGNYGQLLLKQGRKEEASLQVKRAFEYCDNETLEIELWYYRYAHFPEFRLEAEQKIERLLKKGVRSLNWDFSGNIDQAIKEGHPNQARLKELAKQITEEGAN